MSGIVDGKLIKKFLFGRASRVLSLMANNTLQRARVIVEVEAFDKDHAVKRLEERWPSIPRGDWDFLDVYDYDCDIGMMGEKLPLFPSEPKPRVARTRMEDFHKLILNALYGKFARK